MVTARAKRIMENCVGGAGIGYYLVDVGSLLCLDEEQKPVYSIGHLPDWARGPVAQYRQGASLTRRYKAK